MADELTIKANLIFASATATSGSVRLSKTVTQDKSSNVFDITTVATSTTPSQLSISSGTIGYVWIRNTSTTSGQTVHVQVTNTSGVGNHRFATLPIDGGICIFPLKTSGAVWVQAETGTPTIEYALIGT